MDEFKNPFSNGQLLGMDFDPAKYHAMKGERGKPDFIMSRGELVTFAQCPQKWLRGVEDEETKSTEFGCLFDCVVLSGNHFLNRFMVCPETYPDKKTGEAKPWTFQAGFCKEWRDKAEGEGKTVVKADVNGQAHAAAERLLADPVSSEFLSCCKTQVCAMAEYFDDETEISVPIKILLDLVPDPAHPVYGRCLADLKTARTASERQWATAVVEMGLHVQAALYLDVFRCATKQDRDTFLHIIVENSAPWEPCRTFLTQEFIECGRMDYLSALRRYCQCLKTGEWPSYNHAGNSWPTLPGFRKCEPPQWLLTRFTE